MSAEIQEKCGVVGVFGVHDDAARVAYNSLFALQHRGQEGTGIGTADGDRIMVYKGPGLITRVYTDDTLGALPGFSAIGHNRYGTSGIRGGHHLQPVYREGGNIALAHNGNCIR